MTQAPPAVFKIPTKSPQAALRPRQTAADSPQPASGTLTRPARRAKHAAGAPRTRILATGTERGSTRGCGEVSELECGITVYPARSAGGPVAGWVWQTW